MLASRLAPRGLDEALLVTPSDAGRLWRDKLSIFWVADGSSSRRRSTERILASITRAVVLDVTGAVERPCTLDQLLGAEEAFADLHDPGGATRGGDDGGSTHRPITGQVARDVAAQLASGWPTAPDEDPHGDRRSPSSSRQQPSPRLRARAGDFGLLVHTGQHFDDQLSRPCSSLSSGLPRRIWSWG